MRTANIVITLSISFLATIFGMFLFFSGHEEISRSAAATAVLSSIALISLAYALLSFKHVKAKGQAIILLCYVISLISGTLAGSNIGLIPYIIESMQLNFIEALDYVWPTLLAGSVISICSYIAAYKYCQRSNAVSARTKHACA